MRPSFVGIPALFEERKRPPKIAPIMAGASTNNVDVPAEDEIITPRLRYPTAE
jgi:hypothetical protein